MTEEADFWGSCKVVLFQKFELVLPHDGEDRLIGSAFGCLFGLMVKTWDFGAPVRVRELLFVRVSGCL